MLNIKKVLLVYGRKTLVRIRLGCGVRGTMKVNCQKGPWCQECCNEKSGLGKNWAPTPALQTWLRMIRDVKESDMMLKKRHINNENMHTVYHQIYGVARSCAMEIFILNLYCPFKRFNRNLLWDPVIVSSCRNRVTDMSHRIIFCSFNKKYVAFHLFFAVFFLFFSERITVSISLFYFIQFHQNAC